MIDNIIELTEFIESNMTVKEIEKKLLGEVFTPLFLVEEMLDTLPKEVWTNPKLKWLEPGSGMGNFTICVFYRLMDGLKYYKKDEKEREKYIIENMLYMAELNPANVHICKSIFKAKTNGYKVNIYEGDFLELDTKKVWGIDKFDVIVGNPPYNAPGKATGNTLWQKFVEKSLEHLMNGTGLFLFIHPPSWRKPESDRSKSKGLLKDLTFSRTMTFLKILGTEKASKIFKAGTAADYYLVKNKINDYKHKTKIIDEHQNISYIDISNWKWLPNFGYNIIKKMIDFSTDYDNRIIYNRGAYGTDRKHISDKKTKINKYPIIHTTPKSGVRYVYSSVNDKGHFGIPKVIFGDSGVDNAIIDFDGKYGMTENSMAIPIINERQGLFIHTFLKSNIFDYFRLATKWGNFRIDWRMFRNLNELIPPSNLNFNNIEDVDFYKYFDLTRDEIIEIENTIVYNNLR